jgi:hypothetical protein
MQEGANATGIYKFECRDKHGILKWSAETTNVVTTVGKNLALDSYLSASGGAAPGGSGPYLGLIDSSGYSAVSASDTMVSHGGWSEFSGYSGTRKTPSWSSASSGSKAFSAAVSFSINATGTVQGGFLVYGTSASTTIGNTSGTLYSASAFSGGSKSVASGDTLNVTYSASL